MSVVGRFRMVVPAATAKPSPKIGQALGQLGINMMSFCKEFNARTSKVRPEVPIQVVLVPKTDRSYKFFLRAPDVPWFLLRTAHLPKGSDFGGGKTPVGNVTLKEVYHIARAKSMDPNMVGVPLRAICISIIGSARAMGIRVTRNLLPEFSKRDDVPIEKLEQLRKEIRLRNKAGKRGKR
eukprot:TRINITY_DN20036_c0_g1_i1.p1 TRINITY_DN20036_c0_g1~~TRINITY_DN20036_c0_g1_i1.p1  ORF type:complete len:180 (-),score=30.00 TRINITY_DN20036_c0_g1_i1:107-646(-)